jgi:hypothetical protein
MLRMETFTGQKTKRRFCYYYIFSVRLTLKVYFYIIPQFDVVLTLYRRYYVEIKCQLDATDDFYCISYCLLNIFRAPLCPSSGAREYYTDGCCLWYLVLYSVKQQPANRTHNLQLHTIPTTWKPKHQIRQAATTCIIFSSFWWWV